MKELLIAKYTVSPEASNMLIGGLSSQVPVVGAQEVKPTVYPSSDVPELPVIS